MLFEAPHLVQEEKGLALSPQPILLETSPVSPFDRVSVAAPAPVLSAPVLSQVKP